MTWDANKTYALLLLPLVIAAGLFFLSKSGADPESSVRIGDREWRMEVADTAELRAKGLSGRDSLCADCAMLFIFDTEGSYGFWMKEMRIPIDIAWISKGKIVHVERRVPADFGGIMTPEVPADMVLETNAGDLDPVPIGADAIIRK
jgi:uncharacterized membrane protein (UPF0127 family)